MLIPAISNGVFVVCYSLWVLPWTLDFHVARGVVMGGFAIGNLAGAITFDPINGDTCLKNSRQV
jgi:hypothetical protein